MSNNLVPRKAADGHLVQYDQMCKAISVCYRFDECNEIINRSVALAAYYRQLEDTETEMKFYRIKVRAWRRIGELLSSVDVTRCETQAAKIKAVKAAFSGDPTVAKMTDSRIGEIMRLMAISDADFEYAIKQNIKGSLGDIFRRTPAYEAQVVAENQKLEQRRKQAEKPKQEGATEREAKSSRWRLEDDHLDELWQSANIAMKDVGITLERKDRANIKQVVFLIKAEVHAVMRRAAFDKKITMQDVLRRGLKLWLEANGYEFPDDVRHQSSKAA